MRKLPESTCSTSVVVRAAVCISVIVPTRLSVKLFVFQRSVPQ